MRLPPLIIKLNQTGIADCRGKFEEVNCVPVLNQRRINNGTNFFPRWVYIFTDVHVTASVGTVEVTGQLALYSRHVPSPRNKLKEMGNVMRFC